jgi:GH15 family glucan-1,4-alpha-glucosidase
MNTTPNSTIPTESFFVANEQIMAAIGGGQLTTDHNMGLMAFYAPDKDSPTLIQSTRVAIAVDGRLAESYDHTDRTTVIERGYDENTHAVRIRWQAESLDIEDLYFCPPGRHTVIQKVCVRNLAEKTRDVKLFAILYPQLGSPVPHKKGACREASYHPDPGCVIIEDQKGNVLSFGFTQPADEFQVGEVCGHSDVYYDLEDLTLSGQAKVQNVVLNAALALNWPDMKPGEERTVEINLGWAATQAAAVAGHRDFLKSVGSAWDQTRAFWAGHLQRSNAIPTLPEFGPRLPALERRARMVLAAMMLPDGTPMGGVTTYHNRGQIRNSCYILSIRDELGCHDEARGGYDYYMNYKLGDQRFCSADENDALGTILHIFRERFDMTGDLDLVKKHKAGLFAFADKLVGLADPKNGLVYSERSIHEFVAISRGYEIYVNTMSWRGLADAAVLAGALNCPAEQKRYQEAAAALRRNILKTMVTPDTGIFVKRIYQGKQDSTAGIAMLTPALFGLLEPNDPIVTNTIAHVRKVLWDPQMGGLYRYPLALQPSDEHPYGGPWVTYTSWLARLYILRGELDEAAACIRWVIDNTPADSNLIPEHFSVQHLGQRGFHRVYLSPVTPELWATTEFLRAVMAYAKATKRKVTE